MPVRIKFIDENSSFLLYADDHKSQESVHYKFGRKKRHLTEPNCWIIPLSEATIACDEFSLADGVEDLFEFIQKEDERNSLAKKIKETPQYADVKLDMPDGIFKGTLMPHQPYASQFMVTQRRCLNLDQMGIGKTVEAMAAMVAAMASDKTIQKVLIVCPSSTVAVWERHFKKFLPIFPYHVAVGQGRRWDNSITITTFDTLARDFMHLDKFDIVIADEIHKCKNPSAKRTLAMAVATMKAKYVWGLTGTAIHNHLGDLFSIMMIVNRNVFGDDQAKFVDKYMDVDMYGQVRGYRNVEDFKKKFHPFFIRRTKDDEQVQLGLPPKVYDEREVILTGTDMTQYEKLEEELILEIEDNTVRVSNILVKMLRLKQICCGRFNPKFTESSKFMALIDLLDEMLGSPEDINKPEPEMYTNGDGNTNDKCVIFSQFQEVIALLDRYLPYKKVCFTGSGDTAVNVKQRPEVVKRFQEDESVKLFLATVQTGGESIDLWRANHVVHFDLWWNPQTALQAEDRCHRFGQKKSVNVYKIIAAGTIEEIIEDMLAKKLHTAATFLDGGDTMDREDMRDILIASRKRRRERYKEVRKKTMKI